MRYFSILTLIAVLAALSLGLAFSQVPMSASEQNAGSRYVQLSGPSGAAEAAQVFGNNTTIAPITSAKASATRGSTNVAGIANATGVFSRNPSLGVNITEVDLAQKWVEVTNQGVATSDLTGWMLTSGTNVTYTFPAFELESGASVRVRDGAGNSSKADIYTNSSAPLWIGNEVDLRDATGVIAGQYNISAQPPKPTTWVNPLSSQIQY